MICYLIDHCTGDGSDLLLNRPMLSKKIDNENEVHTNI